MAAKFKNVRIFVGGKEIKSEGAIEIEVTKDNEVKPFIQFPKNHKGVIKGKFIGKPIFKIGGVH